MDSEQEDSSGFITIKDNNKISVVNILEEIELSFDMDDIDIIPMNEYKRYISDIESVIRNSEEYTMYKAHFFNDLKLDHCMIHSDITSEMAPIEMHHGPIFNLFEIVEFEILRMFLNKEPINSPAVFEAVMKLHWEEKIQVVALCVTCHKACHPKKKEVKPLFLDIRSAHGDVIGFIEHYGECFSPKHIKNIQIYNSLFEEYVTDGDKTGSANMSNMKMFNEVVTKWEMG